MATAELGNYRELIGMLERPEFVGEIDYCGKIVCATFEQASDLERRARALIRIGDATARETLHEVYDLYDRLVHLARRLIRLADESQEGDVSIAVIEQLRRQVEETSESLEQWNMTQRSAGQLAKFFAEESQDDG